MSDVRFFAMLRITRSEGLRFFDRLRMTEKAKCSLRMTRSEGLRFFDRLRMTNDEGLAMTERRATMRKGSVTHLSEPDQIVVIILFLSF